VSYITETSFFFTFIRQVSDIVVDTHLMSESQGKKEKNNGTLQVRDAGA
jgi:hypothetical protein